MRLRWFVLGVIVAKLWLVGLNWREWVLAALWVPLSYAAEGFIIGLRTEPDTAARETTEIAA